MPHKLRRRAKRVGCKQLLGGAVPADSRGFIPVNLCSNQRAMFEANGRHSLSLSPPASAINAPEAGELASPAADRDRLRFGDLADDLESRHDSSATVP